MRVRATWKVQELLDDDGAIGALEKMRDEAAKVEELATEYLGSDQFSGRKTAILDKARETKHEATEMMETCLSGDVDGLDGFEFPTMAEAGEVGHWKIVAKLNEQIYDAGPRKLTDYVIPMQERHLDTAIDSALSLASQEDATGPA